MDRLQLPHIIEDSILSARTQESMRDASSRNTVPNPGRITNQSSLHRRVAPTIPPKLFELTEDIYHPDDSGASSAWSAIFSSIDLPDVRFALNAKRVIHNLGDNTYAIEPVDLFETLYESGRLGQQVDEAANADVREYALRYRKGDRVRCFWSGTAKRWEFDPPWEDFGITLYNNSSHSSNLTTGDTHQIQLNAVGDQYGQAAANGLMQRITWSLRNHTGRDVTGIAHYSASVERVVIGDAPRDEQVEVYLDNDGVIVPGTIGRLSSTTVDIGPSNVVSGSSIVTIVDTKLLRLMYRYVDGDSGPGDSEWNVGASGCHLTFEAKRW